MALAAAPLALFMLGQKGGQIAWIPETTIRTVVPTFKALVGFGGLPLLAGYFIACGLGLLALRRLRKAGNLANGMLILAWSVIPTVVCLGVSLAIPIVRPQYLIVIVPGLCILAAAGLDALRSSVAVGTAALLLLIMASTTLPAMYKNIETHDWRGATRFMLSQAEGSDGVVFYVYYGWTPFAYYANPERDVPESIGTAPALVDS